MANYQIKQTTLIKYIGGVETPNFEKNKVINNEYEYFYDDYDEAFDTYRLKCKETANLICCSIVFVEDHTIQLIRSSNNEILFHFHCNNF